MPFRAQQHLFHQIPLIELRTRKQIKDDMPFGVALGVAYRRQSCNGDAKTLLSDWPVKRPDKWLFE
jgi:hypothetical protein